MEDLECHLARRWRLTLGDDSRFVMPVAGHTLDTAAIKRYPVVTHRNVLGHVISYDGSATECVAATLTAMWRAFYVNIGRNRRAVSLSLNVALMNRACGSVARDGLGFNKLRFC